MTYDLFIGDRMFSSWSLRGWAMLETFGLPHRVHMVGLYSGTMARDLAPLAPARLVPVLRTPEGTVIGETLAMAETLAERHPDKGMWPADPAQRATARWLCAEMATGFAALRGECPMQLMRCYKGVEPSAAMRADLARLEELWDHARAVSGAGTGWLFGAWSLADVFFLPVAARIVGYGLPVGREATAYARGLLATRAMRDWRAEAMKEDHAPEPHRLDLPAAPWPAL